LQSKMSKNAATPAKAAAKPAAAKPAAPAPKPAADPENDNNSKINALLPNEIIASFEKFGDDALDIDYKKMHGSKKGDSEVKYGNVKIRKYDPKKPTGPHPLVPLNIMVVGLVSGGCPEKKPDAKAPGHSAMFNTSSTYELQGVVQRYGEARVQIAEVFKRKMEALIAAKQIPPNKITTGVQMDIVDPTTAKALVKTKIDLPREEWIIRVEIPFKKENRILLPGAEPECVIRDIAQCQVVRLPNGHNMRDYDKVVKVTVEGAGGSARRVPINYGNFHKFLVSGSKITGIERCDSWHVSPMGNGLSHKFPEIIVARGSGKGDYSLASKLDSAIFDKMAAEAATDEQIEANRKAALLNGADGDAEAVVDDADMPPEDGTAPNDTSNDAPPEEAAPIEAEPEVVDEAPVEEEVVPEPEPPKPVVKAPAKPAAKAPVVKPAAEPKVASPKAPVAKVSAPKVAPAPAPAKASPKLTTPTSKPVVKPAAAAPVKPPATKPKPKAPTPPPIEEEEPLLADDAPIEDAEEPELGEVVDDGDFDA
jgi:hypothetical protein